MVIQDRRIDLASSHAAISSRYAAKSDSGKYVTFTVDTERLYLPGDIITATIFINPATVPDVDSIDVDFKGEVHTFGWVHSTSGRPGGAQRRLQQEKQIFLNNTGRIQLPSMQCMQIAGKIRLSQRQDDQQHFEATSEIPLPRRIDSTNRLVIMPCIYHDSHTGIPAAMITYHWKVTVHRKGLLKSDERQWRPIMVMPTAFEPANDFSFSLPLRFPPSSLFRRATFHREIKKFVVKTTGLMTIELAIPDLNNWPIFRPVPVVVRMTMRAKNPSDLLEPNQFTLPTLPSSSTEASKPIKDQPHFIVQQMRQTRVTMSSSDMVQYRSVCKCQWDNGHIGNGFRQQADGKGFEAGGKEGSTPVADQRASEGQSHGWTWPSRENTMHAMNEAPVDSKRSSNSEDFHPASSSSSKSSKGGLFHYISSSTLFGKVYLAAKPSIKVQNLEVVNQLQFFWPIEGVRNDVEINVCAINVNLGLDHQQAQSIPRDELQIAAINPEGLEESSVLLQGDHYDRPPPLLMHHMEEQLPRYPGPSNTPAK